jgi:uncharacterized membrane protein
MFAVFSLKSVLEFRGELSCCTLPACAAHQRWRWLERGAVAPGNAKSRRETRATSRIVLCAAEGEAPDKAATRQEEQSTWVAVKASIVIEAPRSFVYRMFADLGRVKEWSASLARVSRSETDPGLAEWKFSWQAVELEWATRDTRIVPNQRIEWRSVSGLEHVGAVLFEDAKNGTFLNMESTPCSKLTMNIQYDAKSPLAAAILRAGMVRNFVETAIRMDLNRFRDYCLKQQMLERRRMRETRNQAENRGTYN